MSPPPHRQHNNRCVKERHFVEIRTYPIMKKSPSFGTSRQNYQTKPGLPLTRREGKIKMFFHFLCVYFWPIVKKEILYSLVAGVRFQFFLLQGVPKIFC